MTFSQYKFPRNLISAHVKRKIQRKLDLLYGSVSGFCGMVFGTKGLHEQNMACCIDKGTVGIAVEGCRLRRRRLRGGPLHKLAPAPRGLQSHLQLVIACTPQQHPFSRCLIERQHASVQTRPFSHAVYSCFGT
ncbi:unnamed protein product [Leptosia nina]|uniref:Uncharacterized protein n=1 Tax=Leptosia nina TaxID=320188 RepID=A0AAV1K0N6_9NEOP